MYNAFYYLLSLVMLLQVYSSCIIGFKIDSTIRLINEQMVASTITYHSLIEAIEYKDETLLIINQEQLINLVNFTLSENLTFLSSSASFYFYDFEKPFNKESINDANSVQIKISISYLNQNYERILRYEPSKK